MLALLFNLDVKTLICVLFFGNLTSVILISVYLLSGNKEKGNTLPVRYVFAKIFQAAAYLCLLYRGLCPDFVSVNIGNTLLFTGFFLEAMSILSIIHEEHSPCSRVTIGIYILTVLAFNITETLIPSAPLRVATASVGIFCILIIPICRMLFMQNLGSFKRIVGLFYLGFLLLLLPRAIHALANPIDIHGNFFIQSLTFLSMVMLLIYSLPAYLLLMKEKTDKAINTMATTDFLTGLPNRYSFLATAAEAFEEHKISGRPLTVIFFDIDHFKKINDTYGHAFGDVVLKFLGDTTRNCLRSRDVPCRYGGEEFVALLSDVPGEIAVKVGQRLMNSIAVGSFAQAPDFSFTISIGAAGGIPTEEDTLESFVKKADTALYQAKNAGRNTIVEYREEQDAPPPHG